MWFALLSFCTDSKWKEKGAQMRESCKGKITLGTPASNVCLCCTYMQWKASSQKKDLQAIKKQFSLDKDEIHRLRLFFGLLDCIKRLA